MRKTKVSLVIVILAIVLFGCGCKHEWEEATCDKPKTCKLCGETEGEPLGHSWVEASCENPRKCSNCGITEGEALGHKWEDATCTEPRTCSVCGKTEGEALGHDFASATLDTPKTCRVCGETEGEPIKFSPVSFSFLDDADWKYIINDNLCVCYRMKPQNFYTFTFYDMDGNKLNEQTIDLRNAGRSCRGWNINLADNVYSLAVGYEKKTDIKVYDYDFNLIIEKTIDTVGYDYGDSLGVDYVSYDGFQRIANMKTNESFFGIDLTNKCECPVEDFYEAASKHGVNFDYDVSKWSHHVYDEMINGYLVERADDGSWGYVDSEDNEIKMFKDASAFTQSGYALVSNDGKTYDLIDTDMNVIAENIVEGKGASLLTPTDIFKVTAEDGSVTFYAIN